MITKLKMLCACLAILACAAINLQCRFGADAEDDVNMMPMYKPFFGTVRPLSDARVAIEWDIDGGWAGATSNLWRADTSGVFRICALVKAGDPRVFVDQNLHSEQGAYRYVVTMGYNGAGSLPSDTISIRYGRTFKWFNYFGIDQFSSASVISPDNSLIYTAVKGGINVYNLTSGAFVRKFGQSTFYYAMTLFNNGTRLVTLSQFQAGGYGVNLWNTATGTALGSIKISDSTTISQMALSPSEAMIATPGPDSSIQIRSLPELALLRSFNVKGPSSSISQLMFSPDNATLLAMNWTSGVLAFYEVMTGRELRSIDLKMAFPSSMAFLKDGSALVTCSMSDGRVSIWSYPAMVPERTISSNASQVAAGNAGLIYLYGRTEMNVISRSDPNYLQQYIGRSRCFSLSPDGSRFAIVHDKSISVLSPDTEMAWHRIK